ncbi:acyltransferase [Enterococcus cecorum]
MKLKSKIKKIMNDYFFRRKFKKNNSSVGKIISCENYQYVYPSNGVRIKDYCRIDCISNWHGQVYHPSLEIGNGVIINDYFTAFISDECKIGDDCIFANRCTIVTENHGMNPEEKLPYHAQNLTNGPVIIGSNCWIATDVIFLPNSSIGDNVVVAAHSVVNKKFPSNVIIGGAPAKIIKEYNFEKHCWEKVE